MEIICYRINPGIDESLVGDFMVQVQLHQDNMIAACLKSSARYTKLKGSEHRLVFPVKLRKPSDVDPSIQ